MQLVNTTLTDEQCAALRAAVEEGLPLTARPYQTLAVALGSDEQTVLSTIEQWLDHGLIKRMGIVVQHRKLGYVANAMVVWDIANDEVDAIASKIAAECCVTLCYRRPRRLPDWPYNLFSMIHGKDRGKVLEQLEGIVTKLELQHISRRVLFSTKQFKQRGAHFSDAHRAPVVTTLATTHATTQATYPLPPISLERQA